MKHSKEMMQELKEKAINELLLSGWWPADVAAAFGMSQASIYKYTKALRAEGRYISKTCNSALESMGLSCHLRR